MQAKLSRFPAGAEEEQNANHLISRQAAEARILVLVNGAKNLAEFDGPEDPEGQAKPQHEEQIAHAIDDEGLHRRRTGAFLFIPIANQQIGGEANAFPAKEQLHQIIRRYQHQHHKGEQRQIGEEARRGRVMRHVADAIKMDQRGNAGDHRHHDNTQRVITQRPIKPEGAHIQETQQHQGLRRMAQGHLNKGSHAANGSQRHAELRGPLRSLVTNPATKETRNGRTQQREENGADKHRANPSGSRYPRPRSNRGCGSKQQEWQGQSRPQPLLRSG